MEDGIREILGKHNDLTPMQQLEMNYILAELEYGHHSRNKMMAFFDSNGLDFNLGDEIADNNECFNANYYDFTLAAARDLIRKENYKLIQRDGQCYLKGITGGTICEYAIKNEYKGKFVLYEKIFVEAFASLSRRTQKDIFKLLEKAAAVPRNPGGTEPNKPDGKRALKYEEEMKKFAIRYGCFQNEKGIVAEVSEHDLNTLAFLMGFSREDLKDQLKQIIDGDTCISVAYTNGFRGLERFHPKQNHKTERAIKAPAVNLAM